MHTKTLARPLFISFMFALPLAGCVAEWHDGEQEEFSRSDDDSRSCVCPGDDTPPPNDDPPPSDDGCPSAEGTIYVSNDDAVCDVIDYTCPDTHTAFGGGGCGCGCEPIPSEEPVCPTEDAEGITRVSRDLKVCSTIMFTCPEGSDPFNGTCGCGCIAQEPETPACPDPASANVHYLGEDGSAVCEMVDFECSAGCVKFNDACGCGCIEP
jgi:hypothetical protein